MSAHFNAKLLRPAAPGDASDWGFVVLPKAASDTLPRRGRTSVTGKLNGHAFNAVLEPDGQLSHWLRLSPELQVAAGVSVGDEVSVEVMPIDAQEPVVPVDFQAALDAASVAAQNTWQATTVIARVDWVHWVESAKQEKTRASRIASACDQLAKGKKRVCCFDQSGYYDKSLKAPDVMQ